MSPQNELDDDLDAESVDDEFEGDSEAEEPAEGSANELTLEYDSDAVDDDDEYHEDDDVDDEEDEEDEEEEEEGSQETDEQAVESDVVSATATDVSEQIDRSESELAGEAPPIAVARAPSAENLSAAISESRVAHDGPAAGVRRADADGFEIVDTLAGRSSCFGFGYRPIVAAIRAAAEDFLGDSIANNVAPDDERSDNQLLDQFTTVLSQSAGGAANEFDSVLVTASADEAIECVISAARSIGDASKYRTVTLIGSDHGRTALCRTASGRPELHEGFGPMVAGFSHVPADNVKALKAVVDEQTAAVMIAPVNFSEGVRTIDDAFLAAARELCDQYQCALIIDESRLAFGTSGGPLTYTEVCPVRADAVILSAGLLGGLAGGFVLASGALSAALSSALSHGGSAASLNRQNFPLVAAAATATLSGLVDYDFETARIDMQSFAIELAERIGGYEFVRDLNLVGMTIGIESDLDSAEIVLAAARRGLRLETAGATTVRMQLPVAIDSGEVEEVLTRIGDTFEAIERVTSASSV